MVIYQNIALKGPKQDRAIVPTKRKVGTIIYQKQNARTSIRKCWDMFLKIRGTGCSPSVKHIEENGQKINQPKDIANTIGEAISTVHLPHIVQPNFDASK